MEIETENLGDNAVCIAPSGELDLYNADRLKAKVLEVFDASHSALVIDLSQLSYIDSSGVGVLLFTFANAKRRHITIYFSGPTGAVRRVIELTSLLGYLPITDSRAEAVEFLDSEKK